MKCYGRSETTILQNSVLDIHSTYHTVRETHGSFSPHPKHTMFQLVGISCTAHPENQTSLHIHLNLKPHPSQSPSATKHESYLSRS
jgi:hypothetical protein